MAKLVKRKPKLVHYTHHSCLANGLRGAEMMPIGEGGYREHVFREFYGQYARYDAGVGINCRWTSGRRESLLTLDLDAVTCTDCREGVEYHSRERYIDRAVTCERDLDRRYLEGCAESWCDEKEMQIRTWLHCCRHGGAPCPIPRRDAIKRLREERAIGAYKSMRRAVTGSGWIEAARSAPDVEKALAKLDPADRKLMRGVLARAKQADALLEKAAKMAESIDTIVKTAAIQIRKSAAVEWPAKAGQAVRS